MIELIAISPQLAGVVGMGVGVGWGWGPHRGSLNIPSSHVTLVYRRNSLLGEKRSEKNVNAMCYEAL